MMEHTSRYPDAMPLKNTDTGRVTEAPEEILSDLEIQFVSDCMKEVFHTVILSSGMPRFD